MTEHLGVTFGVVIWSMAMLSAGLLFGKAMTLYAIRKNGIEKKRGKLAGKYSFTPKIESIGK